LQHRHGVSPLGTAIGTAVADDFGEHLVEKDCIHYWDHDAYGRAGRLGVEIVITGGSIRTAFPASHDSVTTMFETIVSCYDAGAYGLNAESGVEYDLQCEEEITLAQNPQRSEALSRRKRTNHDAGLPWR